jgi:hypothetical protein
MIDQGLSGKTAWRSLSWKWKAAASSKSFTGGEWGTELSFISGLMAELPYALWETRGLRDPGDFGPLCFTEISGLDIGSAGAAAILREATAEPKTVGGTLTSVNATWLAKWRCLYRSHPSKIVKAPTDFRLAGRVDASCLTDQESRAAFRMPTLPAIKVSRLRFKRFKLERFGAAFRHIMPEFGLTGGKRLGSDFLPTVVLVGSGSQHMPQTAADPESGDEGDSDQSDSEVRSPSLSPSPEPESAEPVIRSVRDESQPPEINWITSPDPVIGTPVDVPGDGDCGLHAMAAAMTAGGRPTTVKEMKQVLEDDRVTPDPDGWTDDRHIAHLANHFRVEVVVDHTEQGTVGLRPEGAEMRIGLVCLEDQHFMWIRQGQEAESASKEAKEVRFRGGGSWKSVFAQEAWPWLIQLHSVLRRLLGSCAPSLKTLAKCATPEAVVMKVRGVLRSQGFGGRPDWTEDILSSVEATRAFFSAAGSSAGAGVGILLRMLQSPGIPCPDHEITACGVDQSDLPKAAVAAPERVACGAQCGTPVPRGVIEAVIGGARGAGGLWREVRIGGPARFKAAKVMHVIAPKAVKNGWSRSVRRVLGMDSHPGEWVLGMLVWFGSTVALPGMDELLSHECCFTGWADRAKDRHLRICTSGSFLGHDIHGCEGDWTYLHNLVPKQEGEVNWAEEIEKRRQPPPQMRFFGSAPDFETEVKRRTEELFLQAPRNPRLEEAETWWARRCEWAVSGSAGVKTDAVFKDSGMRAGFRANKLSAVSQMKDEDFEAILQGTPRQDSRAHTKRNELGGKLRAIYGVGLEHYLVSSLTCNWIERAVLKRISDVGAPEGIFKLGVASRIESSREGDVFVSFDFNDFNSHHSVAALQAIQSGKRAWMTERNGLKSSDLRVRACDWLIEAEERTTITFPEGTVLNVRGGMLSGKRDTSLANTVLNRVYCSMITDEATAKGSVPPSKNWHNGDDVLLIFKEVGSALCWVETALSMGFRATKMKCFTRVGCGEYLRKWCSPAGEIGSKARAIGNFVNGNWDSAVGDAGRAALIFELGEHLREMDARGVDPRLSRYLSLDLAKFVLAEHNLPGSVLENGQAYDSSCQELRMSKRTREFTEDWESSGIRHEKWKKLPGLKAYSNYLTKVMHGVGVPWDDARLKEAWARGLAASEGGVAQGGRATNRSIGTRAEREVQAGVEAWEASLLERWKGVLVKGLKGMDMREALTRVTRLPSGKIQAWLEH